MIATTVTIFIVVVTASNYVIYDGYNIYRRSHRLVTVFTMTVTIFMVRMRMMRMMRIKVASN